MMQHATQPKRQAVPAEELADQRVQRLAVLERARLAIHGSDVGALGSEAPPQSLTDVRAQIQVLDVRRADAGAGEPPEQGIELGGLVAEVRQQRS
jgi:hypothetical protein